MFNTLHEGEIKYELRGATTRDERTSLPSLLCALPDALLEGEGSWQAGLRAEHEAKQPKQPQTKQPQGGHVTVTSALDETSNRAMARSNA